VRVLIHARHRYPARRDDGTGLEPRTDPSGAPNHVLDLLVRGLAEEGVDVTYLLPAGADEPLPEGVALATEFEEGFDVFHNLEVDGRPWFVTVHGHRPPGGYYDRVEGGELVPAPGRGTEPPWELPAGGICASRTLAETFGGGRWILNGMDPAELEFSAAKEDYLLFLAGMQGPSIPDIWRHKGLEDALSLSGELGFRLVVAGTVREREVGEQIAAMCADAGATYLGDVRGARKSELLAGARALLFPTRLHEGCPLVIIEALMSGTPVVASDRGACPELVTPEVGFVGSDRAAYEDAIGRLGEIDPATCREVALERFHYRRMAAEYVREFERGLGGANAEGQRS
jgi:glycosyltransferase involved in cell wall biosynthesis